MFRMTIRKSDDAWVVRCGVPGGRRHEGTFVASARTWKNAARQAQMHWVRSHARDYR